MEYQRAVRSTDTDRAFIVPDDAVLVDLSESEAESEVSEEFDCTSGSESDSDSDSDWSVYEDD